MEGIQVKMILALILTILASSAALANNPSCQPAGGLPLAEDFQASGSGTLCVDCEGEYPVTTSFGWDSFNLEPQVTGATCASTRTGQDWQMTAHIAGYSGDGIHDGVHDPVDLTNGGHWSCTGNSPDPYPAITANGTAWGSYNQTSYPPAELGRYTSPAPNVVKCSNEANVPNCARWSQWLVDNLCEYNGTHTYTFISDSDDDKARDDIGFGSKFGSSNPNGEDACINVLLGNSDSNNTIQTNFSCGIGSGGVTSENFNGGDGGYSIEGGQCAFLPIQICVNGIGGQGGCGGVTQRVDAPGEMWFVSQYGDATISSSTFEPVLGPDSSGKYPVVMDIAWQTNATGADQYKEQYLADVYITHGTGGTKNWGTTPCVVEYDARLNPCPSTVCPCTSSTCS